MISAFGEFYRHRALYSPNVGSPEAGCSLRYLVIRLLVTWTVARDGAQFEVASNQGSEAWAQMVIADRLADVQLIDLHTMYFVSFHSHGLSFPSLRNAGPCHLLGRRIWCVEDDRHPSNPGTRSRPQCAASPKRIPSSSLRSPPVPIARPPF